jgi:hypothetical protein
MKRVGWALPAQHHTMEGGVLSFQAVDSLATRAHSSAVVTSATMEWKRWAEEWAEDLGC